MESEMSIVKFAFMNLWSVLLNSRPFVPTHSLLIKLLHSLIEAEPEPDKKMSERVHWIYENTSEKILIPLSIVEFAVYKNLDKGVSKELSIYDKDFNLAFLYKILDEVNLEISQMSVQIAKKYSLEIPQNFMNTNKIQTISID